MMPIFSGVLGAGADAGSDAAAASTGVSNDASVNNTAAAVSRVSNQHLRVAPQQRRRPAAQLNSLLLTARSGPLCRPEGDPGSHGFLLHRCRGPPKLLGDLSGWSPGLRECPESL